MKIDIAGPMVAAHVEGIDAYTPIVDGRELKLEHGDVGDSLANLSQIVSPRRAVAAVYVRKRQVLVTFNTGESYLATGFQVPASQEDLEHLARFVFKNKVGGAAKSWHELANWYRNLRADYEGPLSMPDTEFASEESGVIATGDTQEIRVR